MLPNIKPGDNIEKTIEAHMVIRFQDCDPLRHLNNSKYFDYYFNAREDRMMEVYGLNYADVFTTFQTGWVAYNHNISYIRPALPGEWVRIMSNVIYYNEDTVVTEFYMTDDSRKELKNVLWTTSKYIDVLTGKRTPHQEQIMNYLEAICLDDFDFANRDKKQRIHDLKHGLLNA